MKIYSWLTTTPVLVRAVFCVAVIMSRSLPQGTDRDQGLIDEYQIVVNPIVLGQGRTIFEGVRERLALKLTNTRAFGNGNVLLCYQPTA